MRSIREVAGRPTLAEWLYVILDGNAADWTGWLKKRNKLIIAILEIMFSLPETLWPTSVAKRATCPSPPGDCAATPSNVWPDNSYEDNDSKPFW